MVVLHFLKANITINMVTSLAATNGNVPQTFWHQGPDPWKTILPQTRVGYGLGMIQEHYIYCALYLYYYYINATSDNQPLDPRGGDPWSKC